MKNIIKFLHMEIVDFKIYIGVLCVCVCVGCNILIKKYKNM